mmetsp:Transcript_50257/g.61655  ORF Transcript_50257/g.61655 Transcript_50257/m.61655 type:complete len:147 (-) Transcript_50257:486-926(-)
MAYVTNSARGHFDYPNYKPYEINVLKRIQKQGWYYGKLGKFKWQAFIFPALFIHQWIVVWRWVVYRRNELWKSDEKRDAVERLYPLYKHEENKFRYNEQEKLRFNARRAAMELDADFDFDELTIYHFPERHPDEVMAPRTSPTRDF